MLNKAKILKEMIQIYMLHQCRSWYIVIGLEMITPMIHKIINSIIFAYTFFENGHRNVLAEMLDSIFLWINVVTIFQSIKIFKLPQFVIKLYVRSSIRFCTFLI